MKLWFVSRERFTDERARALAAETALAAARADLVVVQEQMTARHTAEIERLRGTYEQVIATQGAAQKAALEQMMNLIQFGMPQKVEAVVEEREPDAATRAARRVTEETVAVAVSRLREEYEKIGVPVTDEELADEARSMILGERWVPPASLATMLRD